MDTIYKFGAGILLILSTTFASCNYDEDSLTASGTESGYSVPQGNQDYDTEIVDFYEKYGSCLLYKFTDKDAYWTPSAWNNGVVGAYTDGGQAGFIVAAADTQYIGKQLELLHALLFDFYTDSFLKKFLPVKVLLCSSILSCEAVYSPVYGFVGVNTPAYYNYDNICLSYGSSAVDTITTAEDSSTVAMGFNRCLMESMVGRGLSSPTTDFTASATYTSLTTLTTNALCWARGVFPPYYSVTPARDWYFFMLMMVSYPESYLTRTPTTTITTTNYTETAWEGILNSAKDVNGLMLKRYTIVRNYFIDNYGMDLQSIGNYNKNY
ncbi:MAG: hypothetical protein H6Q14_2052 [Bacteroidetes bacterium]|nr:hypothetical protein [Bacteroidota bacterium]